MTFNSEKTHLIPVIESEVFVGHEDARFAVGMVSADDQVVNGYKNEFAGAAEFRAMNYVELGFVNQDDLSDEGYELDSNDSRSVHFVVLERIAKEGVARVVGNMRLIVKSDAAPLPVERFFPEVFSQDYEGLSTGVATAPRTDSWLPVHSAEVSRLLARHEVPGIQQQLKWPMFISGLKHVQHNDLGPVLGLLAPTVARSLMVERVPIKSLAEAKHVEEIHATKQPVSIDVKKLSKIIGLTGDLGIDVSHGGFSYLPIGNDANEDDI